LKLNYLITQQLDFDQGFSHVINKQRKGILVMEFWGFTMKDGEENRKYKLDFISLCVQMR
jgi:hypothetical protein